MIRNPDHNIIRKGAVCHEIRRRSALPTAVSLWHGFAEHIRFVAVTALPRLFYVLAFIPFCFRSLLENFRNCQRGLPARRLPHGFGFVVLLVAGFRHIPEETLNLLLELDAAVARFRGKYIHILIDIVHIA